MAVSVAAGDTSACTTDAERISVAKTRKGYGNAVADSAVRSITRGLRLPYAGVECNITNV